MYTNIDDGKIGCSVILKRDQQKIPQILGSLQDLQAYRCVVSPNLIRWVAEACPIYCLSKFKADGPVSVDPVARAPFKSSKTSCLTASFTDIRASNSAACPPTIIARSSKPKPTQLPPNTQALSHSHGTETAKRSPRKTVDT